MPKPRLGIYIHIPFCASKCGYCDFYSLAGCEQQMPVYQKALIDHLLESSASIRNYEVDSIYFGGGTPSYYGAERILELFDVLKLNGNVRTDTEVTVECNPDSMNYKELLSLREEGVNRLSIGTQSFSDEQLRILGRTHTAADNRRAVLAAHEAGFEDLSCDLMLATPDQTAEVLESTLAALTDLPISHVSAYMLQVEEGTPLSRDAVLLERCPDDDATVDRYLQAVRTLEAAGLKQYEVSSFARDGRRSVHNLKYWQCEPYLGIGAGAHSCFGGKRFCVPKDIGAFMQAARQPEEVLDANPLDREERLMLGLRLTDGVPESALSERARRILPKLTEVGDIRRTDKGRIALTAKGFAVSNAVIAALLE